MAHRQPHPTHPTRTPRAHRDVPMRVPRHAAREAWHVHPAEGASPEPETIDAQTVFYVARGVAVLLAAVAVGLGAMSDDTEGPPNPPPASSLAITR